MEPKKAAVGNGQRLFNWAMAGCLALVYGLILYQTATGVDFVKGGGWMLKLLILLTAIHALTCVAKQLHWQYVLPAGLFVAVIGSAAQILGWHCGIPFGPYVFGPNSGGQLFNELPWTVPFLWIAVVFNSRGVAKLILKPWRKIKTYGFWLIGITGALVAVFDLGMDPFLARLNRYWIWSATKLPVTWAGAPVLNFLGWTFVALIILAFVTPLLIKKMPGTPNTSDYQPLGMWVGAMVLFGVAMWKNNLWPEAILDAAAIVVATVPAIRGGRW